MKLTRVNQQVHMVTGTNVNWALVADGCWLTLVDAGYPRDAEALLESITAIGHRPGDVTAILLTHAHLDHMGGIPTMTQRWGTPVMTGAEETRHGRREYLEQITPAEMLRQCTRPAGVRWVTTTLRAVGSQFRMALDDLAAVSPHTALDVPGGLVAVPTPGHTRGHTSYLMVSTGVLFSGDTLVTGHPLSRVGTGPQKLPSVFNASDSGVTAAIRSLQNLAADTLIPGHGDPLRAPIASIVEEALQRTP